MEKKTWKTIAICSLIIAIGALILSGGAFIQVLQKDGKSSAKWSVQFTNPDLGTIRGTAEKGTLVLKDTTVILNDVVLKMTGDSVTYTFDVTNHGTLDAKLSSVILKNSIGEDYSYRLTYLDGEEIKLEDTLSKGETKHLKVEVVLEGEEEKSLSNIGTILTYIQK